MLFHTICLPPYPISFPPLPLLEEVDMWDYPVFYFLTSSLSTLIQLEAKWAQIEALASPSAKRLQEYAGGFSKCS